MGTEQPVMVTQVARIRVLALETVLRVRELTGNTTARNLDRGIMVIMTMTSYVTTDLSPAMRTRV